MPSENTITQILQSVVNILSKSTTESSTSPEARKKEFEESIEQLPRKPNSSVYVYDDTYGWVLVKTGFTHSEAKEFATVIVEFSEFEASVPGTNVLVTSCPPDDDVVVYEDVFTELSAPIKSGIKHALSNYI